MRSICQKCLRSVRLTEARCPGCGGVIVHPNALGGDPADDLYPGGRLPSLWEVVDQDDRPPDGGFPQAVGPGGRA
jgi:hypothetical protein